MDANDHILGPPLDVFANGEEEEEKSSSTLAKLRPTSTINKCCLEHSAAKWQHNPIQSVALCLFQNLGLGIRMRESVSRIEIWP